MKIHEFPWESLIFHKMDARPPPWWKPLIFPREFWCFWRVRAPQNAENPWNSIFLWEKCKISNDSCIFHKNPGNVWFSACLRATPPKHQYSLRNINGFKHVMKPRNHGNRKKTWNSMKIMDFHVIYWNSMKFLEIHIFFVTWEPLRPHGWKRWYS